MEKWSSTVVTAFFRGLRANFGSQQHNPQRFHELRAKSEPGTAAAATSRRIGWHSPLREQWAASHGPQAMQDGTLLAVQHYHQKEHFLLNESADREVTFKDHPYYCPSNLQYLRVESWDDESHGKIRVMAMVRYCDGTKLWSSIWKSDMKYEYDMKATCLSLHALTLHRQHNTSCNYSWTLYAKQKMRIHPIWTEFFRILDWATIIGRHW